MALLLKYDNDIIVLFFRVEWNENVQMCRRNNGINKCFINNKFNFQIDSK